MDKQNKSVQDIIDDLRSCGFDVRKIGVRYRVTNPNGDTAPAFLPERLTASNVKPMIERLKNQGYDTSMAEAIRRAEHDRRVAEDARKAQEDLRRAEELAAARTAEQEAMEQFAEEVEEFNRQLAAQKLAKGAVSIGAGVRFDTIQLDADFARELLRHNREWAPGIPGHPYVKKRSNRPVADNHVDGLKQDMLLGNWVLIPQGIALDRDGNLLDGQHRLRALIAADAEQPGISIPMVISYDWDPEVFDRIDQGRNRSLADLLGLLGEGNRHLYGTALRLLYRHDHDPLVNGWRAPVSETELLHYLEEIEAAAIKGDYPTLRETVNEGTTIARGSKLIASSAIVGLYVCRRAWPDGPHAEFGEGLRMGYIPTPEGRLPLPTGDARDALRTYLVSTGRKRGNGINAHQLGLYIKTWRQWLLRRKVQIMRLGDTELFPVPPSGPPA